MTKDAGHHKQLVNEVRGGGAAERVFVVEVFFQDILDQFIDLSVLGSCWSGRCRLLSSSGQFKVQLLSEARKVDLILLSLKKHLEKAGKIIGLFGFSVVSRVDSHAHKDLDEFDLILGRGLHQ